MERAGKELNPVLQACGKEHDSSSHAITGMVNVSRRKRRRKSLIGVREQLCHRRQEHQMAKKTTSNLKEKRK